MNYPLTTKDFINQVVRDCRSQAVQREKDILSSHAALSTKHNRFHGGEDDHRLPYKRDVDRIIHSKAYPRYTDKTQVVYLIDNDHVTHRSLHVQLVSNFAKGIAEILHLNLDLVEAIALGHDVGHPPFGHEGEGYLSELCELYGIGKFAHSIQSCRLFFDVEPLNLGMLVYDGFLCHDGGMCGNILKPLFGKTWDDHFAEIEVKKRDPDVNIWPGSLEGCLVKLCDTVSYIGRDFEDAISLGIIHRNQVPQTILGNENRKLLSVVAQDVIENSFGKDYIAISQNVYDALNQLRAFNFDFIYVHPKLKIESIKIKRSYKILFETLLTDWQEKGKQSYFWHHYLSNKPKAYQENENQVQLIVDYVAGMTDRYFVKTLENLVVPKKIEL